VFLSVSHPGKARRGLIAAREVIVFDSCDWGKGIVNDYYAQTVIEGRTGDVGVAGLGSQWPGKIQQKQQDTGKKTSKVSHEQIFSAYGTHL
jgi:hypothetical protein